jgi:hypothetical protein
LIAMPHKGQQMPVRALRSKTAENKKLVLEQIANGATLGEAADYVGVSRRVLYNWRHGPDEKFKVAFADAYDRSTDKLKAMAWQIAEDPETPSRDRILMLFFLLKQRDPSFRDNSKLEHALSPGLGKTLTELAKLAGE